MKIKIARDELLTGLQRVQGIVEKRNTMPILSNILLETKQDGIELVATDLEIGVRGHYKADVQQAGSVSLSARKLYELLKEVAAGEITITTQENNWVQIQAGRSQFKIVGIAASEFPALPTIEREGRVAIPGSGLASLIRKTLFAVGDNDARYILNGLLITLHSSDKKVTMKLVGTDGHRLAVAESDVTQSAGTDLPKEIKAIIPRKAAQEIRRLLEEEEGEPLLGFTKNLVTFQKSGLFLTSRVMEGTYPNYQQVIPKESAKKVAIERTALESALRRVAVLSKDKTNAVKVILQNGSITLHTSSPDVGEATEDLPAQYRGESLTTGFNARYLLDALAVMDGDTVNLEISSPLSPCVLKSDGDPGFLCVVMPMKI
ncbi:MAG: DNA polymerase III subunit beta [Nitrospirae bacterium RIFCSPLOWO2_12_FULL_63_8]|nr:MAG: DNA polymerase III subunit beta [Nitrospirae bacterium RIFCSPLOWO2_12_FULL_63_8]